MQKLWAWKKQRKEWGSRWILGMFLPACIKREMGYKLSSWAHSQWIQVDAWHSFSCRWTPNDRWEVPDPAALNVPLPFIKEMKRKNCRARQLSLSHGDPFFVQLFSLGECPGECSWISRAFIPLSWALYISWQLREVWLPLLWSTILQLALAHQTDGPICVCRFALFWWLSFLPDI